ncbi:hypothetical protein GF354_02010 [Candidatus Peregrinibacteria bacterium]|nr:hypothetical protein [Candidatus Peregrinibacteria bacterium]
MAGDTIFLAGKGAKAMQKGQFTIEVMVHGRPVTEYPYGNETFVEGKRGSEYTLKIRNNSDRKAMVVLSVDGLSIMTGQTASKNDGGYLVSAYSHIDIPGWRLNDQDVASFQFGSLPQSYASQMGKPANIGVIGGVFYLEKRRQPVYRDDYETLGGPMRGGGGTFGGVSKGIGTGFGRRQEHRVNRVSFDREDYPAEQMTLRYDDRKGLERRGIYVTSPHPKRDRVLDADPFPGGGCQPPKGWRG